jgi:hypothetical protein
MFTNRFAVLAALVLVSPALVMSAAAQQKRGPGGGGAPAAAAPRAAPAPAPHVSAPAPAPHISAPAPHVSAPAAPRFSAPAPHISAPSGPRFSAPVQRVAPTPHVASPRFSAPQRPSAAQRFTSPRVSSPRFASPRVTPSSRGPSVARGVSRGPSITAQPRGSRFTATPSTRLNRQAVTPNASNARRNAITAAPITRGIPSTRTTTVPSGTARTVGQGPAAGGRSLTTAAALSRAPNGRMGVRNTSFASLSPRDPAARTLARSTFGGRFGAQRNAWTQDWRWRHHRHFPFVLGFIGPVFWPYAYDDFIDYAFYPYAYDTFWPYAYDDFYEGIYGAYAPDIYPYVEGGYSGYGYAEGGGYSSGPSVRSRRGTRVASAPPSGGMAAAPICSGQTQGLTDFPVERIAQQVQPDQNQQALLDQLKDATAQALQILQQACPTELESTPVGRMNDMRARVDAMLRAVQVVRPALDKFYASLSDEQKQRFNALDEGTAGRSTKRVDVTQACGGRAAGGNDVPFARIERSLRLSGQQETALGDLKNASAQAADILAKNCEGDASLTPTGRLAAMEQRLQAMLQALDTVQPALARFYDSLSDEQKAQFNRLSRAA